jgi:hypothetical protein
LHAAGRLLAGGIIGTFLQKAAYAFAQEYFSKAPLSNSVGFPVILMVARNNIEKMEKEICAGIGCQP